MSIQARKTSEDGSDQMFQSVDNVNPGDRQQWIRLIARAPEAMLESALAQVPERPHTWLRRPETGLFMVQGRVGGTGNRFNLGEMTVTRCALRLAGGPAGVAYVQGRSHRRAELAALADALMQTGQYRPLIESALLEPLARFIKVSDQAMACKAQSTRVDFLTVAREAGVPGAVTEEA